MVSICLILDTPGKLEQQKIHVHLEVNRLQKPQIVRLKLANYSLHRMSNMGKSDILLSRNLLTKKLMDNLFFSFTYHGLNQNTRSENHKLVLA